jgi:hypothetical protein
VRSAGSKLNESHSPPYRDSSGGPGWHSRPVVFQALRATVFVSRSSGLKSLPFFFMAESNSSWLSVRLAPLAGPMYCIAALLIVTPLGDFLSGVWPWRPGALDWRFASSGLLSGFLLTPLLGALIAIGIAALVGHDRMLRVFGLITLIAGGACVVILGAFSLDVVQLKSRIPEQQQRSFLDASIKAFLKYVLASASSIWLGVRAYQLGRWKKAARATVQRDTIVIGSGSSQAEPLPRQGHAAR